MIDGVRKSISLILSGILTSGLLIAPRLAQAQFQQDVSVPSLPGGSDLPAAIITIVNVLLVLAAIVAAIFVIIGGVQYMTASGDEEQAKRGRNTVLYAAIGLIIIGLAAVIVNFVLRAVRGGVF
jgi:ABC-type Fe3+ transport system permease subunit